jgi:hypothetical protein
MIFLGSNAKIARKNEINGSVECIMHIVNVGENLLRRQNGLLKLFLEELIMTVEYGEFKGNKLIILKKDDNDTFPFQFGKGKAKLIVDNFAEIKKFAEEE